MGLRRAIASGGTMAFEGYGDLSLTELLPAILTRYSETELLIAAPSLPDQAAEAIFSWMQKTWARMDGQGRLWRVAHLTIVTDVEQSPMVEECLGRDALGERLTVINTRQEDTVILLPDFAVTGPVNLRYGAHFTAEATTEKDRIDALWEKYMPKVSDEPSEAVDAATDVEESPEEATEAIGEPPEEETPASEKPKGRQQKKRKDAE